MPWVVLVPMYRLVVLYVMALVQHKVHVRAVPCQNVMVQFPWVA